MTLPRLSNPQEASLHGKPVDRRIVVCVCVLLAALIWFVFGRTVGYGFINYDDNSYVYENPNVSGGLSLHGILWAFTHSHAGLWHPLTTISLMLDCQLYGLKAGGIHFTNVFLHMLAAILLFLVLREMTGTVWRSAFVAALFAIHPLRVESVAWVAERKDVLSGVFLMLTLGAYLRYVHKPSLARYATMSVLFACGLMSKATFVPVPFVLLLLDYWPLKRIVDLASLRRLILEKIPLVVLSAGSSIVTTLTQTPTRASLEGLSIYLRISNAFASVLIYIGQMFWPVHLAIFYPHPLERLPGWMVAISVAVVAGISLVAIIVGKKRAYVPVGWFWYLIMLLPVLGIVQVGLQGHADRFTYLPQIGLYLLVTWGIADLAAPWRYRRQIVGISAAVVIAVLAWLARTQTQLWRDTETLWIHALAVTTNNDVAHANLADILLSRNQVEEAIAHFENALAIRPDNPVVHNKIGFALLRIGNVGAAIGHWKAALESDPHDLNAESNLAWVFAASPEPLARDGARAVEMIQDVLQRSGRRNAIILRTLAAAYAESGRFSEAISAAQEALDMAVAQGSSALAADLQHNIDNYKMNTPLRDPSLAHARPSQ